MFQALTNTIVRIGTGITRSLVLIAALMFVSDSFAASLQKGDDACATRSCISIAETSDTADASHSSEDSFPCSGGDHCHQHHCQTLAAETTSMAPIDALSFSGIEPARGPVSPFLDLVPRPPAA